MSAGIAMQVPGPIEDNSSADATQSLAVREEI